MHPLYGTTVNRRRRLSATPRRALSLRAPERRGEARLLEKSLATFHLSTAAPWLREKQLAQIHLAIRTYEGTECRMTLADPRIRLPHAGFVWAPDTAFHVWCARKVCLGAQKKRSYPKEKRLDNTGCRTQQQYNGEGSCGRTYIQVDAVCRACLTKATTAVIRTFNDGITSPEKVERRAAG